MQGNNVLFPYGFDAFGLPAENAAIDNNIHPSKWTWRTSTACAPEKRMGTMFDWSREVITCLPEYYRWNQWFFLQFYKRGLAYRRGRGRLVPELQHDAGARAGRRRDALRALRHARDQARPGAVVLPHHRLRGGAAELRRPGLAGARQDDADELDRPQPKAPRSPSPPSPTTPSRSASSPPAPTRSTASPSWSWRRSTRWSSR